MEIEVWRQKIMDSQDVTNDYFSLAQRSIEEVGKIMVGQKNLIERLIIGLLADGHILVEGVPGLAKTTAIKSLSDVIQTDFSRLQFTPDLLPADLIGTQIYIPERQEFEVKKGPIFANIVLADEINRAPAKVQSALLEAMQEKQVSIGDETFKLPSTFLVMATQNPVEQEGTYPLPEAQVDRFMLKVLVDYPTREEEVELMKRVTSPDKIQLEKILNPEVISKARSHINSTFIDDKLLDYISTIVLATRYPKDYGLEKIAPLVEFGASPRASINFVKAAKAKAFLSGRSYVIPDDIKGLAPDILRHRIMLSYEAEAQEITTEHIIEQLINMIQVP